MKVGGMMLMATVASDTKCPVHQKDLDAMGKEQVGKELIFEHMYRKHSFY